MYHLKALHELVRKLNILDDNTQTFTYELCSNFIRKLTQCLFITINKETSYMQYDLYLSWLNKFSVMTRMYGPMYICLRD